MEDNVTETQTGVVASAATETAAEAVAEKPVRKRASRRVTAPAGEAAAAVTVEAPAAAAAAAPAVAEVPAAAAASAEAAVEAPAEAPKKRVTRARKKVAEEPAAEAAEPAAAPAVQASADAPAEAPAEAAAEAPKKRVTRARKKVAEAPAADTAATEAPATEAPAAEAAATEAPETEAPETEAPATQAAAEPAANAATEAAAEEPVKKTRRARVTKASKAAAEAEAAKTAEAAAASDATQEAPEPSTATQAAAQPEAATDSDTKTADTAQPASEQNEAEQGADQAADTEDSEKPARGRTRSRRGQKQESTDGADSAQNDNQNQRGQRGQRNGNGNGNANANGEGKAADAKSGDTKATENQNGPEQNKQGDKNGDTRSSRTRQRDRKRRGQGDDLEPEITEDDVLLPIAGILDVLDNYAFVRTSGYLPGTSDVYVSLGQVKKYGMKRGDAIVGAIRQPREGEQSGRQKYNAIVKVDSVNGRTLEENEKRVEFSELAAIYPERQLKLANGEGIGQEIDKAAPVGLGQRGLLVVPKPARGVEVLSQLAASVSANAPDAHLMLLLTNAQPEDITHLTRTVNGEVVAASFERPAEDQATVAELGIDRARRLAELGHDVVVLVDSVGDLARAYAQAQPVSARPAHGVIDEFAVTQVRRVLGAARNAENAGSLTVLATAASKTGVAADKQLLRELRPVANCEIRFAATSPAQVTVVAERSHTRGASALQPTSAA